MTAPICCETETSMPFVMTGSSRSHLAGDDARRLAVALALIVCFMIGEAAAGLAASSLALLSDAAHMLTDALALGLSLVAARLARRPADGAMTYGYGRSEIVAAQVHGATLLALGVLIAGEAVRRLARPPDVEGAIVVVVAVAGAVVNAAATLVLAGGDRGSLNVEGAFRHIATDLVGFVATALAGVVILATGFARADGIASLLVAGIMLRAARGLLRDSGRVLLEAAPPGIDPAEIAAAIRATDGVREVRDLHVWQVTSGFPALSAHVDVGAQTDCHVVRRALERLIRERFNVKHTTLQVDHEASRRLPASAR
jgi:cobalt-zinc-cadmium efflux system protein